jgi:hypothetical protein
MLNHWEMTAQPPAPTVSTATRPYVARAIRFAIGSIPRERGASLRLRETVRDGILMLAIDERRIAGG